MAKVIEMVVVYNIIWSSASFAPDDPEYQLIKKHGWAEAPWADPAWKFDEWAEACARMAWCLQQVRDAALIVSAELMPKAAYDALPVDPLDEKAVP